VVSNHETGEVVEMRPITLFQPWCYAVDEGQAKTRVNDGGAHVDSVLRLSDHDFAGDVAEASSFNKWTERYNVVDNQGAPSDIPVYTLWHRYFQKASGGLQFGGWYRWRQLYTYRLDIVKAEIGSEGNIKLDIRPGSLTDHVRVRPFNWAVVVTVYTKDRFSVRLLLTFELQSVNVDQTLFGRDRWEVWFSQVVANRAIIEGKSISVFNLLGGGADAVREQMAQNIKSEITDRVRDGVGIQVNLVQIPGYLQIGAEGDAGAQERKALTVVPIAEQNAKVRIIESGAEAEGEANIVSQRANAMGRRKFGHEASLHQALETASEKGATIFANLGTGGQNDPMSQAILSELQKMNKHSEVSDE
jgi:hypothetical protein